MKSNPLLRIRRVGLVLPLLLAVVGMAACGADTDYEATSTGVLRYGSPPPGTYDFGGDAMAMGDVADRPAPPPAPVDPGPELPPTPPPAPTSSGSYRVLAGGVTGGGVVKGTITLASAPPIFEPLAMDKDHDKCGGTQTAPSECIVFDPATLGLANCVVTLEGVKEGKAFEGHMALGEDDRTALLDQKGCVYIPHVMVVRENTLIAIKNSDTADHNVNTGKFNKGSPPGSFYDEDVNQVLEKTGRYTVVCNVHNWMTGYIVVVNHPYVALTGKDGRFEIKDVPPGTYTLRVWHEGMDQTPTLSAGQITGYSYGTAFEKTFSVEVQAGGEVVQDVKVPPPAR